MLGLHGTLNLQRSNIPQDPSQTRRTRVSAPTGCGHDSRTVPTIDSELSIRSVLFTWRQSIHNGKSLSRGWHYNQCNLSQIVKGRTSGTLAPTFGENLKPGKLDLVAGELSAELTAAATRRAKIICTIGPSCNSESMLAGNDAPGYGRSPAEFLSRYASGSRAQYCPPATGRETGKPHHLHPAGSAGPQDTHRAAQGPRTGRDQDWHPRHHYPARCSRHSDPDLNHIPRIGQRTGAGSPDFAV